MTLMGLQARVYD